ncbi:MAG: chorismate mutase [Chitinispirillia bacterium]|nr:chorismate mutase [Chitinispirillia bacterium]MCL2240910.1 chorismate mutase [Chitinispirillia bacterium]
MEELNLDNIASRLEGLEETIIHRLIDRAQWCVNEASYAHGQSGFINEELRSLFELRLWYHEEMDAKFGRFCVPEERPFNGALPAPQRTVNLPETGLHIRDFDEVNFTDAVLASYRLLLPKICPAGDDGQYGSSVEHDVYAVQAIARRLHFGALYVAESKYRADVDGYRQLIEKKDKDALLDKLTRPDVEKKIIARVKEKVKQVQATINKAVRVEVKPESIIVYYKDFLIPMTKQGQIIYLLNRELGC